MSWTCWQSRDDFADEAEIIGAANVAHVSSYTVCDVGVFKLIFETAVIAPDGSFSALEKPSTSSGSGVLGSAPGTLLGHGCGSLAMRSWSSNYFPRIVFFVSRGIAGSKRNPAAERFETGEGGFGVVRERVLAVRDAEKPAAVERCEIQARPVVCDSNGVAVASGRAIRVSRVLSCS